MKQLKFMALAIVVATLFGGAAEGAPDEGAALSRPTAGYTYYNRPGASLEDHDLAVTACAAEAARLVWLGDHSTESGWPPAYQPSLATVAGNTIGAILVSDFNTSRHYDAVVAAIENCMVVRGWRIVTIDSREGSRLAGLSQTALAAALLPWIGASEVHGAVSKAWANQAALGATKRAPPETISIIPNLNGIFALSLKMATGQVRRDFNGGPGPALVFPATVPPFGVRPFEITPDAGGDGVIVIEVSHFSSRAGQSFVLERQADGGSPLLGLTLKEKHFKKYGPGPVAFRVPPGRWRIAALGSLSLCLGSPSFDVAAGQVVYAGSFDLAAPSIGPDLSLDRARASLGDSPAAAAVVSAVYRNGSTGVCHGEGIYALEIAGAPFADGYQWGSRAALPQVTAP